MIDAWMDGWMDGRTDGRTNRRTDNDDDQRNNLAGRKTTRLTGDVQGPARILTEPLQYALL